MKKSKIIACFEDGSEIELNSPSDIPLDIIQTGDNSFHILYEGQSLNCTVEHFNAATNDFTIRINNRSMQLQLKEELDVLIDQMGFKNVEKAAFKELKAPMPGLVVDVFVQKGQEIEKGENLLILEAMKMENIIKADGNAKIKQIFIQAGDKVDKNQLLIELE